MNTKILKILAENARCPIADIAVMTGLDQNTVIADIKELEKAGLIRGYKTVIDWEKLGDTSVTALIEIKVVPQRGLGFERIAERISQYEEVESVYLMSGGFDIAVTVSGESLREVACFVSDKLAPLEYVTSTATHFVLKKFKDKGIMYTNTQKDQEREYAF